MKLVILSSILLVFTIITSKSCDGYRILGLFPLQSKSHFIMFEALMKGLARKGHQVDVVSMFPQKTPHPNYTDIIVLPALGKQTLNNVSYEFIGLMTRKMVHFLATEPGNRACGNLGHPEMIKLVQNPPTDPPYDVMVTQFLAANCFLAVGHQLKIPMVGVAASLLYPWLNSAIANPYNLALEPNIFLNFESPMNFWERFYNAVYTIISDVYFRYHTSAQDGVIKKYFGNDAPGVRELENKLALVLINSHVSINGAKPMTSAIVEVGGLHVGSNDVKLSRDLQQWLDDSTEGFIYFTFGSMVTIETFPKEILRAFYKSLAKIAPVRVLVKIVDTNKLLPGLPKNVRTFKWAPQYQVLKHKNIKAFITHGGLMGTQEAIHCGVPMIGVPLFIDQFVNVNLYVKKMIAIRLDHDNITEENLDHALNEILHNRIYSDSVKKLSEKFLDRPMSPLDTAAWWIEYIARGGSEILRSPAMDIPWWQTALLDVYALFLLILAVAIFLAIALLRFIVKVFHISKRSETVGAKKSN